MTGLEALQIFISEFFPNLFTIDYRIILITAN